MSKSLAALAILVSTGLASPAFASTTNEIQVTALVSPHGLNLATTEGQKRLKQRVASASRRICVTNTRDLGLRLKEQQCYQNALNSADVQVAALVEKAVRAKT